MGERLDRLDELERAGTPEPWEWGYGYDYHGKLGRVVGRVGGKMTPAGGMDDVGYFDSVRDAHLAVEARNALRSLIDIARAAEEIVAQDWVELMLDPTWAQRVLKGALARLEGDTDG